MQPAKWLFEASERGTSEDYKEMTEVCVLAGHPCRGRYPCNQALVAAAIILQLKPCPTHQQPGRGGLAATVSAPTYIQRSDFRQT